MSESRTIDPAEIVDVYSCDLSDDRRELVVYFDTRDGGTAVVHIPLFIPLPIHVVPE